ncbi:2-oxoacid:acceptor oxidoreductase subunit alpha [Methanococcoides burtonii]|uniref:2-oxoglutarate synthase subunit KorA n=1 Tax=Methanococcoides burtonii (strain DSM 6242 / NBRC 107633 / OCM 468 / ACE-M) TaxID=259564 RepID=Q12XI7_METBU|nr:2-oxoacid:acceptor oxidoreductase subunit alpha [Methanococcoides burtonii]ABE51839.1 Pyruvate flavodoxin/ferredoxin oxidoreductase-like protein [Methanococcoides burtonii DSM 6242]
MNTDLVIKVGGAAGQGLQTIGVVLAKTFKKSGFNVFTTQFYLSRVRGGHNTYQVRISNEPIRAMTEKVDILIALDEASINEHLKEISDGVVIVDTDVIKIEQMNESIFHVPMLKIAKDVCGNKIYFNSVAIGAALGLMCFNFEYLESVLTATFQKKGDEIIENNIKAARAGYDHAKKNCPSAFNFAVKEPLEKDGRMLIAGNDAVALGALAAGVQFLAAYPMTPSTGVMTYIAAKADEFNVVVEQAEDEIAALNMILGASYAGVRAMTTTSGGGFCLMAEALGLAGMTETPAVIFLSQRPGPATGLPTMTEQGDLQFVLTAAQGEFPRCILAPGTPDDCFYLTAKAFNIAEKFQIPVFVMSDQYLADSLFTCKKFDTSKIEIERHMMADDELKGKNEYNRYELTPTGISPRAIPGQAGFTVVVDSDEHNETGHLDQTIDNRILMNEKRMKKLKFLEKEMEAPQLYGNKKADITLIGWGSTYGPLMEVVDILTSEGHSVDHLHFTHVYPLPVDAIKDMMTDAGKIVCVENNATGQFARLFECETGLRIDENVLRSDGRPYTPEHIIRALEQKKVI